MMYQTSSNFTMFCCRHRVVAWMVLTVLCISFLPVISVAQQPVATIKMLSGYVLVSGQVSAIDTILQVGDIIETRTGASMVLEFSDESEIHIGENTQIYLTTLSQTATGGRVSRLSLSWGRVRAILSPQHQLEGSAFTIETPNALIDVKFSEPDIEVSYSVEKAETIGMAHTVELLAKNLMTHEEVLVAVGSTVIITSEATKVLAGIIGTGTSIESEQKDESPQAETPIVGSSGMGTGTKIALGAGAAALGGGIALAISSSDSGGNTEPSETSPSGNGGDGENPFTGTFKVEYMGQDNFGTDTFRKDIFTLTQNGASITGTLETTSTHSTCCTASFTVPLTGNTSSGTSAVLSWPAAEGICEGNSCTFRYFTNGFTVAATLVNNGSILRLHETDYPRLTSKIIPEPNNPGESSSILYFGDRDFIRQ